VTELRWKQVPGQGCTGRERTAVHGSVEKHCDTEEEGGGELLFTLLLPQTQIFLHFVFPDDAFLFRARDDIF